MSLSTAEMFGYKLRKLRNEKGISQQTLSNELQISKAALSYYENGQRVPDIDTLKKVAVFFNVSSDYLLGLSDISSNDKDLKEVCSYTGLNEKVIMNIKKSEIKKATNEECRISLPLKYCQEISLQDFIAPSLSEIINTFFSDNIEQSNEWVDLFSLIIYYCYYAQSGDIIALKLIISDFFNETFTSYRKSEEPATIAMWHDYPF